MGGDWRDPFAALSALTAFPAMGLVSLPFATKEVLQDLAAFGFPDTGGNQTGMV